jgi:hypothetical protein
MAEQDIPRYLDETPIRIGDRVRIERGRTDAIVEHVVTSPEDIAEWGVSGPGVMLLSEPFGRVYWSFEAHEDAIVDPIVFVARGASPDLPPDP